MVHRLFSFPCEQTFPRSKMPSVFFDERSKSSSSPVYVSVTSRKAKLTTFSPRHKRPTAFRRGKQRVTSLSRTTAAVLYTHYLPREARLGRRWRRRFLLPGGLRNRFHRLSQNFAVFCVGYCRQAETELMNMCNSPGYPRPSRDRFPSRTSEMIVDKLPYVDAPPEVPFSVLLFGTGLCVLQAEFMPP